MSSSDHNEQHSVIGGNNTTSSSCVELLRVTLLSLEGIELLDETILTSLSSSSSSNQRRRRNNNNCKNTESDSAWRITVWAGFRSSFPSGCVTVPTTHYSTIFEREGNLLAVESNQIQLDSSAAAGRVDWGCSINSTQYDDNIIPPQHHLHVMLPPPSQQTTSADCEEIILPDIIEIHVCITCILTDTKLEDEALMSSQHHEKQNEKHFCHGVAHLRVPSSCEPSTSKDLDLSGYSRPGGKVTMLPIRAKPPSMSSGSSSNGNVGADNDNILTKFVNNAVLSVQVEKVTVPIEQFDKNNNDEDQRHYINSNWNGESCAPASVSPNNSQEKENHLERAGQIISNIRQTFSSTISKNIRKSQEEESNDLVQSQQSQLRDRPPKKKTFVQLLKFGCGELGDVLHGGEEHGMYDDPVGSSLATEEVMGR
jgi:hypothetical protein